MYRCRKLLHVDGIDVQHGPDFLSGSNGNG